jgi:hypothetical protein
VMPPLYVWRDASVAALDRLEFEIEIP